jgi:hypothetical protein
MRNSICFSTAKSFPESSTYAPLKKENKRVKLCCIDKTLGEL